MIRLVIFDLDGTLVDAYPAIFKSVNYTLSKLGFPLKKFGYVKKAVGKGDRHLMVDVVGEAMADKALKIYRAHHKNALKIDVSFLPGVEELLGWCKSQGLVVAIATNRPSQFVKIILTTLKANIYFDKVLCADKASRPKPYPDMLLQLCKYFKVTRKQALFVGDMTIDISCGANAQIKTLVVTTGSNTKNELKQLKPYKIINRILSIKQLLKKGSL